MREVYLLDCTRECRSDVRVGRVHLLIHPSIRIGRIGRRHRLVMLILPMRRRLSLRVTVFLVLARFRSVV